MKEAASLVHNSNNNSISAFPQDSHPILEWDGSTLCIIPVLSFRLFKRHVFNSGM